MAVLAKEVFAKRVSQVLNPLVVLAIMIVFVVSETVESAAAAVVFVGISLFFSILIPIAIVVYMLQKGQIGGVFIPQREDRKRPLLLSLPSFMGGVVVLYLMGAPAQVGALMVCVAVLGSVAFGVTLWWKVSLHAAGLWACFAVVVTLWGHSGWLVVLPAGLVSWSRFVLGVHSKAQIVAGSLMGAGVTFLVFGYVLKTGVWFDRLF